VEVLGLVPLVLLVDAFMVVVIVILTRRSKEVLRARRLRIEQRKRMNPPSSTPDPNFQFDELKQE
jgi:hypothetical protein